MYFTHSHKNAYAHTRACTDTDTDTETNSDADTDTNTDTDTDTVTDRRKPRRTRRRRRRRAHTFGILKYHVFLRSALTFVSLSLSPLPPLSDLRHLPRIPRPLLLLSPSSFPSSQLLENENMRVVGGRTCTYLSKKFQKIKAERQEEIVAISHFTYTRRTHACGS